MVFSVILAAGKLNLKCQEQCIIEVKHICSILAFSTTAREDIDSDIADVGHWDTLFLVNRLRPTFRFVFPRLHLGRQGGGTERVKEVEMLTYS